MDLSPFENHALMMAADESALEVGAMLCRRRGSAWPLLMVSHPGDALRHVIRCRPKLLFVCVTSARLEAAAALIAELSRRRQSKDGAPLVGLAAAHDEAIERAARIAGATHYLTLDSRTDDCVLDHLLEAVGIPPPQTAAPTPGHDPPYRGLAPPPVLSRRPSALSRPSFRT